jgi:glycine/D-amino acid oxidase-like deaminating enzyme
MITRSRKLRTHDPLWRHVRAPHVPYRRLTRDLATDVLIVGSGITGAMVGQALAEAGFGVTIVDRRTPTLGATVASTALVQYEIDTPLLELRRKIGARDAARAWRHSRLAVTSLQALFRRLDIEAQNHDALYLAGNRLNAEGLRHELKLRQAAGLETEYLTRAQLAERFGIARSAALLGFGNLAINPRAATASLLIQARRDGASLFAPVEVTDIASRPNGTVARTADGPRIRCRWLVLATGYEFPKLVPMKGHHITTTWAFATRPQPRRLWPEQCLIWEAAEPYLYLRTTPDGRVICGGEDAPFRADIAEGSTMQRKIARLQRKLTKLLPGLDTRPDYNWVASFGETDTGLPTISEIPRHRNCWVALGYGGNGIAYSRIAAEIIRAALMGARAPDADLYAFRR